MNTHCAELKQRHVWRVTGTNELGTWRNCLHCGTTGIVPAKREFGAFRDTYYTQLEEALTAGYSIEEAHGQAREHLLAKFGEKIFKKYIRSLVAFVKA